MRGSAISFLTLASIALPDSFLVFFLRIHPLCCKPESNKVQFRTRGVSNDTTTAPRASASERALLWVKSVACGDTFFGGSSGWSGPTLFGHIASNSRGAASAMLQPIFLDPNTHFRTMRAFLGTALWLSQLHNGFPRHILCLSPLEAAFWASV